jgi:hypothetical protein
MSSKKLPVCINIFPSLDYVELVQCDEKSGEIEKASSLPCQFDQANRQMGDKEQMVHTIRDLYSLHGLSLNTPAVLVLPSFFTREIELPAEFSKEELRFALVSEAERFYVFKKNEPQIDWYSLESDRLLYSAFPKPEIEKYMQVFQELKIPLLSIELSYFSVLRGLVSSTSAVSQEIENNERWCLLVISDNGFFASVQEGVKITKTMDAPLSASDEDENAAIQELQQDFETFSDMETFTKLILVNNANRINSEALLSRLSYQGNLILIEQNMLTLGSRGSQDGQFPCSLEGIGGVFYTKFPEFPRMNFLLESGEDIVGILEYRKRAFAWLLIANAAVFFLCLLAWAVMALMIWQKDQERESITRQIAKLGASGQPAQLQEIQRKQYIKKVVDQNVKVNNALVRLGSSISPQVWLEKIQIDAANLEKPLIISIEGRSTELEQVKTLRDSLIESLQGSELEVANPNQAASADGQSYYTWTIQNKAVVDPAKPSGGEGGH